MNVFIGGLFGALFNAINQRLSAFRVRYYKMHAGKNAFNWGERKMLIFDFSF